MLSLIYTEGMIMENKNNKRIQMCIDIDAEQKRLIKIQAALYNITVKKWVKSALLKELKRQLVEG
jgi:hypothetical protein